MRDKRGGEKGVLRDRKDRRQPRRIGLLWCISPQGRRCWVLTAHLAASAQGNMCRWQWTDSLLCSTAHLSTATGPGNQIYDNVLSSACVRTETITVNHRCVMVKRISISLCSAFLWIKYIVVEKPSIQPNLPPPFSKKTPNKPQTYKRAIMTNLAFQKINFYKARHWWLIKGSLM